MRESLAGRAFVYDLWPLMASELRCAAEEDAPVPLFDRLITAPDALADTLAAEPPRLLGDEATYRIEALDHLAVWGGMPELLSLEDDERQEWLRSYRQTWLERDLADLTRVSDLLPFRTLQRLAMLRTAQFLNYPLRTRMATRTSGTETTRRRT